MIDQNLIASLGLDFDTDKMFSAEMAGDAIQMDSA